MQGVSKRYGGVRALENADLVIESGRIHAVLGENGAGKSTLIKIMAGVVQPDAGHLLLDGQPVAFASPAPAASGATPPAPASAGASARLSRTSSEGAKKLVPVTGVVKSTSRS